MNRDPATSGSLESLLRPRSVAIVGASDNVQKVGGRPLDYLLHSGYQGRLFPVNSRGGMVQGIPCYPSLDELPEAPDCVILSVPADAALAQIQACGRAGARSAVLFSSGFGELGAQGLQRQDELRDAARAAGVRLLGPNSIGSANFANGAVLSFASIYQDVPPQDGPVAVVSQSGAMGVSAYALLRENGIGVRYVCTTGNQADVGVCDCMQAVIADPAIRLLMLYMEDARDLGALERALAAAQARAVPVLLLQGGRRASGAGMAALHTGSAGMRDAALRELLDVYGCRRVTSLPELTTGAPLYLAHEASAAAPLHIGVISNSGASCVLAADVCDDMSLPLAKLATATVQQLDAMLPPFSLGRNPVDLTAMLLADPSLVGRAAEALLQDPGCSALVLSLVAVAGASYDVPRFAADTARAVQAADKPAVFSSPDARVRQAFAGHGLAVFASEREAVAALRDHHTHRNHRHAAAPRLQQETVL